MVSLATPKPRTAPAKLSARTTQPRTPSQPSDPADDPFYVSGAYNASLPHLLTPQQVVPDSRSLKSPPQLLSPFRLPEDAGRPKCCINPFPRPITSLDDLPWISALTIEPDYTDPWDIADLSLLNADWQERGPGPMRRRKTSLRSDPLSPSTPTRKERPSPIPFPFVSMDEFPETPAPRPYADPSEVIFHGLHPIFPSDLDYPPRRVDMTVSP
ncbi:hypothetical protein TRAPUB_4933 [Trametes pubescens]|uniref:Uncharacterized protein n=1 Tax=Trametes pubescens TaxID=154538 RepID=A0A1M2V9R5_TRAPU|nr:hypothetical protein TRAPUB_4933 [Trametes pubescens]